MDTSESWQIEWFEVELVALLSCHLSRLSMTFIEHSSLSRSVSSPNAINPPKVFWWLRNLRQMVSIQLLHGLSQTFMAVVLLIPHVIQTVSTIYKTNPRSKHTL